MNQLIMNVDEFLKKSESWQNEIVALRTLLLKTKLDEHLKWGKPCYCFNDHNIAIIQPFKACLGLMFFKGALLKDSKKLLVDNGPNSQAARRLEFRSVKDITKYSTTIKAYIKEAIAIEESGQKVVFKRQAESWPEELISIFAKKPKLKKAFESLTPGRQRVYILYFSGAKQSTTRSSRIERYVPLILEGKGMNDR
ncbi:MAG: YdeI/OmpD-associated family protein [Bdellovibrionota bacterium]